MGRFEALHGQRLTPLIGREHELAMLLERWRRAKDGDGQVVLIAGDAGIGKSRLLRALREELAGEPHVALRHFCSPYHTNSALHPVITQLERAAGFAGDDGVGDKLAKLEALLARGTGQLDEAVPLIGALLGVPSDGRYPASNLSPQRQKQRTLEVLVEQLAGLARERPVLELYEDVHWVDPSTLELLELLVERVRALPVLVVLTYRPDFSPPWTGQSHVTAMTMNRLGRRQGAAMVDRVTGGKPLPDEVLDQILAKTDGVPLFVEELTRTVLEFGLLTDAGDHYELAGPLPPLAIPATLHDSLMARLDRLAPVKEVAQIGAVIGREFSHELLAAVSPCRGGRPRLGPRPAGRGRADLPPRHAARRGLQLQARPGPGSGLPITPQIQTSTAPRSDCRDPGRALSENRECRAGSGRLPLHEAGMAAEAIEYCIVPANWPAMALRESRSHSASSCRPRIARRRCRGTGHARGASCAF